MNTKVKIFAEEQINQNEIKNTDADKSLPIKRATEEPQTTKTGREKGRGRSLANTQMKPQQGAYFPSLQRNMPDGATIAQVPTAAVQGAGAAVRGAAVRGTAAQAAIAAARAGAAAAAQTFQGTTLYVTGDGVRFRAGASTDSEVKFSLNKNDQVVGTKYNEEWYRVIYKNETGYMSSMYLSEKQQEGQSTGTNANQAETTPNAGASGNTSGTDSVTAAMMEEFGWTVSDEELVKINSVLKKYGIVDMSSIRLFFATCGQESGKGRFKLEGLNKDGSTVGSYGKEERGAGYIQLTWRNTHLKFLQSVNDSFQGEDTASYIANKYPWEAAAWFWSSPEAKKAGGKSLNEYTASYGDAKGIFLITQYHVNGWPKELKNETAQQIRDGKVAWEIKSGRLFVEGKDICRAPNGWEDREKNYNQSITSFTAQQGNAAAATAPPQTEAEAAPQGTTLYVTGDGVRLRTEANTDSEVKLKLNKNDQVVGTKVNSEWYCITYNNETGYMSVAYLTETKPETKPETGSAKTPLDTNIDVSGVSISAASGIDLTVVGERSKQVLRQVAAKAGETSIVITSTRRNYDSQANAMYTNIMNTGAKVQHDIYGSKGDQVIDAMEAAKAANKSKAEIIAAMIAKMEEVGYGENDGHLASKEQYAKKNVIDISNSRLTNAQAFSRELNNAQASGLIDKYIDESGSNSCHHVEISQ